MISKIINHTLDEVRSDINPYNNKSNYDEISNHVEKYIGKIDNDFCELLSDIVHIDIFWVKPSKDKPFHALITSGMSDLPMNTPEGLAEHKYAELIICLPENWDLSEDGIKMRTNDWPIRLLNYLAKFPHMYNTWLGYGHSLPSFDYPKGYASNTSLNSIVLLPSIVFGEDFFKLQLGDKVINFYSVIPLYQEELDLKLQKGVEVLFDDFDKNGINEILNINRVNVGIKKNFLVYLMNKIIGKN